MSKEVALSYEGACHRCGLPGHRVRPSPSLGPVHARFVHIRARAL